VLEPFRNEISGRVLPTSEIAKLAATLAHGRDITHPQNLTFIATQALALWEECEKARKRRIDMLAIFERAKALDNALPKPAKFPVPFDEFVRLVMPKRRPEDRDKLYREFLREHTRAANFQTKYTNTDKKYEETPIPTDDEIAFLLSKDKKDGFIEFWFYNAFTMFQKWLPKYEAETRSKKALLGAEGLKKKRQKNA
jgi:hypothetical protein